MSREYPETVAGPYEAPPLTFEDGDGRKIEIRRYDGSIDTLVGMYRKFDPEDRAQGIPPTGEDQIRRWLDQLFGEDCVNVVACHDGEPVGHAILVSDDEDSSELAIFVLGEYQDAGIGTELIKALLGAGREHGIQYVWLTVERWNKPATALYRKVGFEPTGDGSFELEMAAKLSDGSD
jgi:GNAT superfamily N-acetyltransferase